MISKGMFITYRSCFDLFKFIILFGKGDCYLFDTWLYCCFPPVNCVKDVFFFLNFLAATQDIAVDGWALTMLQRHNVGYASTCNSVGQTAGYFIGYIGYNIIALRSYISMFVFSNVFN